MSVPPWLALAVLIALTLALLYQIATRRFGWRILLYWAVVFAGLIGGEVLAESVGWSFGRMGDLRLGVDLAGAVVAIVALWLLGL